MAFGESVRIYLADKSPTGIRHAEIVNWTGQALACPRVRLGGLDEWSEQCARPGVYFLIASGEGELRGRVYVGESENGPSRLQPRLQR